MTAIANLFKIYSIYLIVLSVITLALYLIDKIKAINGSYRISEKVLLLFSLLGGVAGGFLAMLLFRHKTKHWYFYAVNLIAIILHGWLLFFVV